LSCSILSSSPAHLFFLPLRKLMFKLASPHSSCTYIHV
jgi:hypothetical protein